MPAVSIGAVLFDLDGVITDTARYHYLAWKKMADKHGLLFDEEFNERLRGVPRLPSLQLILEHNGRCMKPAEMESLCTEKNTYYQKFVATITPADLEPNSLAILMGTRQQNVKNILCSSSKNGPAVLLGLGIEGLFDAVVDPAEIENGKPAPDIFLRGAELADLEPAACLVVEDAEAGVEAGVSAGMRVLGIGDPARLSLANLVVPSLAAITVDELLAI